MHGRSAAFVEFRPSCPVSRLVIPYGLALPKRMNKRNKVVAMILRSYNCSRRVTTGQLKENNVD